MGDNTQLRLGLVGGSHKGQLDGTVKGRTYLGRTPEENKQGN